MYGCKVVFDKGFTFDNYLSGIHENKKIEDVLNSIEFTTGIHYLYNKLQIFFYK